MRNPITAVLHALVSVCTVATAARLSIFGWMLVLAGVLAAQQTPATTGSDSTWRFVVSGDSRNCGDIVMPAIAQGARRDGAAFYWHLGDYRAIYMIDEDYAHTHPGSHIADYLGNAWPDFIAHQLAPFVDTPVFLALGNHELIPPKSREASIIQFADWLNQPVLQKQRLADDPSDHLVKTYYHWIDRGVDFITLDNSSPDQLDVAQSTWLTGVLQRAAKNSDLKTVVLGMHAALPDSFSAGHSMNDSAQQEYTGRKLYASLVEFRKNTNKKVYVLSSHSHYLMSDIYATSCHPKDEVLSGWLIGSAGAVRYVLPKVHAADGIALTNVYGYLLATVSPDGTIQFQFKQVMERDIPASVVTEFSKEQVRWCFDKNKLDYQVAGPTCAPVVCATCTE